MQTSHETLQASRLLPRSMTSISILNRGEKRIMRDIRIERWAHTLVNYCLYLKEGDIFAIYATPEAAPLVEAVYREALHAGAHPLPFIQLDQLNAVLLQEGSDAQLSWLAPTVSLLAEKVTARLLIESSSNTKGMSAVDPARAAKFHRANGQLRSVYQRRERAGEYRWCITLYPTNAYAQNAKLSLRDFEEFVFETCFLNDADPIARWKALGAEQQRLVDWLV